MTVRLLLFLPARLTLSGMEEPVARVTIEQVLADNVRGLRTQQNMTQRDLSEASGVSQAYLSRVETGQANPPLATLAKLATALHVEVSALLALSRESEALFPTIERRKALEAALAASDRLALAFGVKRRP